MDRTIELLTCNTVASLPSMKQILAIPRERPLRVTFGPAIQALRESIGAEWRDNLPNFSVGIHLERPEISISKLITEEEIAAHATFFAQCAKDYRTLATNLIHALASHFNDTIDPENAMHTFGKYKRGRQTGMMGDWEYRLHGSDCGFEHRKTGQTIEVYLLTSLEFGILDAYFFVQFMKTTEQYQPLPVDIYEDGADGFRIREKMVALGKFERIPGLIAGHDNIVVRDRSDV